MNVVKHIVVTIVSVCLILGIPFVTTDYFKSLISDNPDAVTSASVIVDKPSGDYLVFINLDKHTDKENLSLWYNFFEGKDVSFIFEDIKCYVAKNDVNGLTMAQNFQSRLPENQMVISTEDGTLMISKAEYNKFDVIVMSQEIADFYSADTLLENDNIDVITVRDEE